MVNSIRIPLLVALLAMAAVCLASPPDKKPIAHSDYDSWNSIRDESLSQDGRWLTFRVTPQEGDSVLHVKNLGSTKSYTIDRAEGPKFDSSCKYLVATIVPPLEATKKARRSKAKPEDMPKNSLLILDLETGQQTVIDKVSAFSMPEEHADWIAYRPEPPKPETPKPDASKAEPAKSGAEPKAAAAKPADPLVLRNIATGKEERLEHVSDYAFAHNGTAMVYGVRTSDPAQDGVVYRDLAHAKDTWALKGKAKYDQLAIDRAGDEVAFLVDRSDPAGKKTSYELYKFAPGAAQASSLASGRAAWIHKGWQLADGPVSFSYSGKRVMFRTRPIPAEEKKDDTPDDEKVSLDIWSWTDRELQPEQLLSAKAEAARTYTAIVDFKGGEPKQLADEAFPTATVSDRGDGKYAVLQTDLPYRVAESWQNGRVDSDIVDLATGQRRPLERGSEISYTFSPSGKYLYGYDGPTRRILVEDPATLATVDAAKGIPTPIWDEESDVPSDPGEYGFSGWTEGDKRLLVYDRFDIWSVDPTGIAKPVDLTRSFGRNSNLRLRYEGLDPEQRFVPTGDVLLTAFNPETKQSGYYWADLLDAVEPRKAVLGDEMFGGPIRAKNSPVYAYTKQDFDKFPDIWVSRGPDLAQSEKMSDANPQQANYVWGKSELVRWTSNDGVPLEGILIKPDNFDYSKKYPMITYFYERMSDNLHRYFAPAPSASIINFTYYASNGYVVFIPDVAYKVGYPGESAMSCILPGIQEVLRRGYVDPKRLGLDGHSWGGYEVAYLVTQSNMFACAFAGAAVADMFSAYGGIRWGSGHSREVQYEHGQSRIGGSPWSSPLKYVENSPVFWADRIETPLLLMNNDKDGAVPWYQGIEFFTALRRLSKPVWMLVYNDEDHNLVQRKNRKDLSVRKQQFFDHYLKGAPMPDWMAHGLPATMKGKTYGFGMAGER